MRTRFLLLAPVLVSVAGCSDKIDAQENISQPSEMGVPLEQTDTAAESFKRPTGRAQTSLASRA